MQKTYSRRAALVSIFALAWPTVLEQVLSTAVSYVDTAMVGRIGPDASAAIGATMTVNWLIGSSISALAIGFLAYIARAVGARQTENAARASAQAVMVALAAGLGLTAVILPLARYVPVWMNADERIRDVAGRYFFIIYIPMVFRAASIVFGTVLRASGDTRTPMFANTFTNLVNVVLNFFLIFETRDVRLLGLTVRMPGAGQGVIGAAVASAIAFVAGGVWMTVALYRNPRVSPRGYSLKPDKKILKPVFVVALPAALQRFATSFGYVAFSGMINTLGATSTAAHSIANTAESAFYIPGYGMQAAASTLIGNAYGENNREKLRQISRMLLVIEVIVMILSGSCLFFGAPYVMRIFTRDDEVIRMGMRVLKMVALSEPVYGIAIIIEGIFNGVGDTVHTFAFNVIGMWGVRILGTFLFVRRLGFGLTAAWGCMIAHNMSLGLMLAARFARGKWNPLAKAKY